MVTQRSHRSPWEPWGPGDGDTHTHTRPHCVSLSPHRVSSSLLLSLSPPGCPPSQQGPQGGDSTECCPQDQIHPVSRDSQGQDGDIWWLWIEGRSGDGETEAGDEVGAGSGTALRSGLGTAAPWGRGMGMGAEEWGVGDPEMGLGTRDRGSGMGFEDMGVGTREQGHGVDDGPGMGFGDMGAWMGTGE